MLADLILLVLLLSGAIWGFIRGLVKAIPSFFRTALPILALGILTPSFFKEVATPISAKLSQNQALILTLLAYLSLGFILRTALAWPGRLLGQLFNYFLLDNLYNILGGVVGMLRIYIFLNALDLILRQWPIHWELPVTNSFAFSFFRLSDFFYRLLY